MRITEIKESGNYEYRMPGWKSSIVVTVDVEAKKVRFKKGYYPDHFSNIPCDAEFSDMREQEC